MTSDHFMSQILPINWPQSTLHVQPLFWFFIILLILSLVTSFLVNLKFLNWFLAPLWTSRAQCIYFGGNIKGKWKKVISNQNEICNMQFSGCELLQKFRKKLQKKEHSAGVVVFVTHTLSTSALCYKVLLMEVCTTKIETATRETTPC